MSARLALLRRDTIALNSNMENSTGEADGKIFVFLVVLEHHCDFRSIRVAFFIEE